MSYIDNILNDCVFISHLVHIKLENPNISGYIHYIYIPLSSNKTLEQALNRLHRCPFIYIPLSSNKTKSWFAIDLASAIFISHVVHIKPSSSCSLIATGST